MKKIVLHACCAPCASYPLELLKKDNFEPVVFFYNPNIFPEDEYLIRKNELQKYCKKLDVAFFEGEYDPENFMKAIQGLELELEKGRRCSKCFELRLKKTIEFAILNKIDCYTTTLSISPHKNSNQIFEAAKNIKGENKVQFIEYNFKKMDGFKISRQIARENNMYAQVYCGCRFSYVQSLARLEENKK